MMGLEIYRPFLSYPILFFLVLFYAVQSYLIQSCPVLSYPLLIVLYKIGLMTDHLNVKIFLFFICIVIIP